jgi:ABC-2 type transport system permease protein
LPSSVRAAYVLITREVRRLLHDPAALIAIIAAPFLLTIITSVSLGAPPKIHTGIGIAGAPVPANAAQGDFSVREVSAADAPGLVRDGTLAAAVVVPANGSAPVVVIGSKNNVIAREVATSIAHTISDGRAGAPIESTAVEPLPLGRKPLDGAEVYGPVIAVFFVLFGVGSISRRLQSERADGTLNRLLASPIRPSVVLASKGIVMFAVGVVEVLVVILTTTLLFGADWGNPIAVALVTLSIVAFGVALATMIAAVTKSSAQAQGLEYAAAMALVALGGHIVPVRNLPSAAQTIAHYTPNGAAIEAFGNIASGTGSTASQLAPLMLMLAAIFVVGVIAMSRIRSVLVT